MLSLLTRLSPRAPSQEVLVAATQANSRASVGALCFIVWDMIIHLDDEVKFIWCGPNTWVKFIYLFIRYFPIMAEGALLFITTSSVTGAQFSERGCRDWLIFQGIVMESIMLSVEIVLIVRVYALYNRRRLILWVLSILFLGEIAVMITSVALFIPSTVLNAQCLVLVAPDILMAYWITSLTFETLLFGLTLFSLFSHMRRGLGERTLLYVFMRDGAWAFTLIFVVLLLNLLMYKLNDTPLAGVCFYWAHSVLSFSGVHVLLNMRRIISRPVGQYASNRAMYSNTIAFVPTDAGVSELPGAGVHETEFIVDTAGEAIALTPVRDLDEYPEYHSTLRVYSINEGRHVSPRTR